MSAKRFPLLSFSHSLTHFAFAANCLCLFWYASVYCVQSLHFNYVNTHLFVHLLHCAEVYLSFADLVFHIFNSFFFHHTLILLIFMHIQRFYVHFVCINILHLKTVDSGAHSVLVDVFFMVSWWRSFVLVLLIKMYVMILNKSDAMSLGHAVLNVRT